MPGGEDEAPARMRGDGDRRMLEAEAAGRTTIGRGGRIAGCSLADVDKGAISVIKLGFWRPLKPERA